ncbi:MAG TPA: hypothetical protein VK891_00310 [Euzebyales bacterium]|nr:hypothetical protein [Euzebyales bacterium]
MLEATSERSLRGRFRVTSDGNPVGRVEFRGLGEAGAVVLADRRLTVRREGRMSGAWLLEEHTDGVGAQVVATAEKPSAWAQPRRPAHAGTPGAAASAASG